MKNLDRYLSPVGAWALAFGCTVGWGAFIMPGTTFLPTAGPMGTIIGMSIGTALMLIISYNYHYLMNHYAGSGGAFTYTKEAFGYDHGFLCAWFLVLTYIAILWANATALVLIARNLAGGILQTGFHYTIAGYHVYLGEAAVSIGAILIFGFMCIISKRLAGYVQVIMAMILFFGIIFCLFSAIAHTKGSGISKQFFSDGEAVHVQIIQVAALVPWAFVGFESVSHSTGEFKFSVRKSFAVMAFAVIAGGIAYTFLTWLAVTVQPEGYSSWVPYIKDLDKLDGLEGLPVFFATQKIMGHTGLVILAFTLIGAVVTGIVGNYIAASRLLYALSGEGIIPEKFHSLGKYNTPAKCIIFIMAVSLFIPFMGRTAVGWIVDVTSVGATIAYGYTSAAAFKFAHNEKRTGTQIIAALGVIISVSFFMLAVVPNFWAVSTMAAESYLILTLWGILGLAFFRIVVGRDKKQKFGKSMIVWTAMLLLLFFVSAIWMRQEVYKDVQTAIAGNLEMIRSSLIRNNLIQMGLCFISLVIILSIFSVRSEREKHLEIAKAHAEKANTAKSEFLASMSHEIRTPINAVLGMNEMIIRESRDKKITTYARNVESAGKNLLSIINDILDFSKIEAGKMEIVNADYKLSSVLNDVTNMIIFKARQKNLEFHVHVDESLPDELFGDAVRVRQVAVNILNNAVKYTDKGSVSFTVEGIRDNGNINLVFTVKDTGIGIKAEDLPKLFGKFQRVDLERNSTVEGTGLGLSITKNLLEMMNGEVNVQSEYGKGSVFTVRIPQKVISDEAIGNFQEKFNQYIKSIRAYKESFKAPDAHILVVDDTDMNLTVVEGLLSKTEIKIDTASSGFEALALTKKIRYDLIFMDQRMPQMDGTQALNEIRAQSDGMNINTPVICLTADAVSGARAKYLEEGFTDYLSKPVEGPAIEEALMKYLPESKVIIQDSAGDNDSINESDTGKSELEEFYDSVSILSYDDALKVCSNEDILTKTLEQFYRSIKANADEIGSFFVNKDYKNYTIKVHALKSSARLIGALKLSEEARHLEDCGNDLSEHSLNQIAELTPKLLDDYRSLIDTLSPLYSAQDKARESAPLISIESLNEAYEAIKEFADSFDIDAIDSVIAEVRKYRIPESEAAKFEMIETASRNMDWNALNEAMNG